VRRHEAVTLLAFGLLLVLAAVTWLAGAWGLLGGGVAVLVCGLFFDFSDHNKRGEGGT
jgi:uncharacterized membrane protein